MPNYRRANIDGGTYFYTVITLNRQTFLLDDDVRAALREARVGRNSAAYCAGCDFHVSAMITDGSDFGELE